MITNNFFNFKYSLSAVSFVIYDFSEIMTDRKLYVKQLRIVKGV
ncbi:Uncharacterized protein dnm_094850 [Desulfonema magnum]|uniref:Uncharacterized protein n=1 Tax=Desulfonema magnum TaxID=45655 RepID=A0A975BYH9_9BACT|nr:Uncharacterized protein dnm_094850 [Desulfonema magnum]